MMLQEMVNLPETCVHLGRIKAAHNGAFSSVSDFTALDRLIFITTLPVPDLDRPVFNVHIGPYTVETIESHKHGPAQAFLANFQIKLFIKDKLSQLGIMIHGNVVPQCREMIKSCV